MRLFFSLIFMVISLALFSQKETIAFAPVLVDEENVNSDIVRDIHNDFIEVLVEKDRFIILDQALTSKILQEQAFSQASEDFLQGEVVEMGRLLGANKMIQTEILSAKVFPNKVGYSADIVMRVRVLDMQEGTVITQETITNYGRFQDQSKLTKARGNGFISITRDAAISKGLNDVSQYFKSFVDESFSLTLELLLIPYDGGNKEMKLLLTEGKHTDINRNQI